VSATVPPHQRTSESLTSAFVYKGRQEDGILASRRSVWDDAVSAIQEHPWFGSGFGTSTTSSEIVQQSRSFESLPQATREHGNSYLAITEWVGFVGGVPFVALVILVVAKVARSLAQMRRTGDVFSPVIPLAGVLAAGLVHAAFEDWLFAVGYYLCVFFWTLAFILVDVLPAVAPSPVPSEVRTTRPWVNNFGVAASRP
jgi:O-antigen ligase